MTATVNLTDPIQRGDSFSFEFNWDDGAEPTPAPLDMRGKTVVLTFKLSNLMEDSEALVTVSKATAVDDAVAQGGKVVVPVSRTESSKLIAGATHYYALRVLEGAGEDITEVTHIAGTVPVVNA